MSRAGRRGDLPEAPSRRTVAIAAVALTGVWCSSALFRVAHPPPGQADRWWDGLMAATTGPLAHGVASTLAVIGTGLPGAVLALVIGAVVGLVRGRFWGAFVVVASIVSALDVSGMKALAQRARPDSAFGLLNAFPSGHTAYAAVLGTVVLLLVRNNAARCAAIAWILAMAWSRTELHAHWLTDVLAAIVAGSAATVLLLAAAHRLGRRTNQGTSAASRVDPD